MIFNPNVMAAAGGGGGAVVGTYTGDGNATRTFTFDSIEPALVIIFAPESGRAMAINAGTHTWCDAESFGSKLTPVTSVDVSFSGKSVTFSGMSTSATLNQINKSGRTYLFVAIPKA